jgi:hypothetical protein
MEGGHFSRLWSSSAWQEQPPWPCAGSDESSGEADASGVDTERSAEESDSNDSSGVEEEEKDSVGDRGVGDPLNGRKSSEANSEADAVGGDVGAASTTQAAEADASVTGQNFEDLDEVSDISDCDDIFHVRVLSEGPREQGKRQWKTREDEQLATIERLVQNMRPYPLMPLDPGSRTGEESYSDMQSCVRLPLVHCAFKGCDWSADPKASELQHWQLEWLLYRHLGDRHNCKTAADDEKMKEVFELAGKETRRRRGSDQKRNGRVKFLQVISYYTAAVCQREREHMPLIGPTNDRRMLALVTKLASSNTIQSLLCFCCDQIYTDVQCWRRHMTSEVRREGVGSRTAAGNEIQLYTVAKLIEYFQRDDKGFNASFGLRCFKQRYGEVNPTGNAFANSMELDESHGDWRCKIRDFPGGSDMWVLCNPEDIERCKKCRSRGDKDICKDCEIPLCTHCIKIMSDQTTGGIPQSLCNDNHWGHTSDILYKHNATWLEMAVASPCWTTILVYYIEGDRGHLLDEKYGRQRWRTRVKGSASTFQMPWEDIIGDLQRAIGDETLAEIPRPAECVKYLLRVRLKIGQLDFSKKQWLKQLRIRPHVVLQLLYYLIEQNHEVFRGKGTTIELKARMRAAVEREYPDTEGHLPEAQRQGHVPESLLRQLKEAEEEHEPHAKRARRSTSLDDEKNATPGPGCRSSEDCLDDVRPVSVAMDRSAQSLSDPATQREGAIAAFGDGDLTVRSALEGPKGVFFSRTASS